MPHFTPGHIIVPLARRMISYTASDERSANLYLCTLINNFSGCDARRYKMQMRLWALASCPHARRPELLHNGGGVQSFLIFSEENLESTFSWEFSFFCSAQPGSTGLFCFMAFPVGAQTWSQAGSAFKYKLSRGSERAK